MQFPFTCARRWLGLALAACVVAGCVRPAPTPSASARYSRSSQPTAAVTATPLPAAPTPVPVVELPKVDAYLARETALGRFSGAALVARDGRILLKKGYGLADRERGLPNTPHTRFHIGSLTKQFTAMAILQLQERGKLRLTDRISTHLADCPPAWREVTIEHLLTHTAGLTDFFYLPEFDPLLAQSATPAELVSLFRNQPLMFRAGGQHHYSNSGYVLLGQIIEQVSGESYADWIEREILRPVGMSATSYGRANLQQDCAVGYETAWSLAPAIDPSIAYAAGGLVSTVEDLYLWDQALYTTQVCSRESLAAMFSPHYELSDSAAVGLGWFVRQSAGRRRIAHTGLLYGFTSILVRYPEERVTIILLSNLEDTVLTEDADYIAEQVFRADPVPVSSSTTDGPGW
jgi:CubicO group peptidase (beta-lactamase class C family)